MTKIEWTKNKDGTQGQSWNPIVGCKVVSPGCTNCYAMRTAHRLGNNQNTPRYAGLTQMHRGGPVWTGEMRRAPDRVLTAPLHRRKPTTYFVNSMSDLFHEAVPDDWIDRVFAVMALCPQHRFQVLTKRAERMREYFAERWQATRAHTIMVCGEPFDVPAGKETGRKDRVHEAASEIADELNLCDPDRNDHWTDKDECIVLQFPWPLPNVWLGVSAEDQTRADERIPHLLATPAAVRFVSAEPLLGPVDLTSVWAKMPGGGESLWNALDDREAHDADLEGDVSGSLDWVIVGGESGPGARPMHPDWARALRDQCQAAGVAFFFKQWGTWLPFSQCKSAEQREAVSRTTIESNRTGNDAQTYFGKSYWKHPDGHLVTETTPGVHPEQINRVGKRVAGRELDGRTWDEMPDV